MIDGYNYPEDFLMDDTFKQYCEGSNKNCVLFWENWIVNHPEKLGTINTAKKLHQVLSGNLKPIDQQLDYLTSQISPVTKVRRFNPLHYGIAASIALILLLGLLYRNSKSTGLLHYTKNFIAKKGEKKELTLPDGTLVFLNSDSKIELADHFNGKERIVRLSGEAYFDVKHNTKKPFHVLTKDFKITVLGTAFNVKSYSDEKESEAALVRGTIKLEDNIGLDKNTIILKAGQKITYHPPKDQQKGPATSLPGPEDKLPKIEVNNLTVVNKQIVESAWTNQDLIFLNNNFAEIKERLERWFNVSIEFEDQEVAGYVYTANFKNENLLTVLHNLQQVKHFNFKQKGGVITITK